MIRAVGVETGGSNVQFAVNPSTEEILVIEMNPRVSRSSALASKATGFPIAKIAARLAVGYLLEEITNDITGVTPASFEPTIDYVVVKWPRFAFEKFPGAVPTLSTHMKSVGEAMAIGRTFSQAFAKALRSRELDKPPRLGERSERELLDSLLTPDGRPLRGDPRAARRDPVARRRGDRRDPRAHRRSTRGSCASWSRSPRIPRASFAGERSFKSVDTCAAEFPARTPYYYSGWERKAAHEVVRGERPSVVILGAGPNRIGQGIEFDYCCVHAAMTVRESGRDAVIVNCNPETVSTDYDTSDRLYFEPLTLEDVLGVIEVERPEGVIVQFGGQTPLEARRRPGRGGRAPARHLRRRDRPRRGPRALRRAARAARLSGPAVRHGLLGRGSARQGRGCRLPAARAPLLRAGRPRDGDRLLQRRARRLPPSRDARRRSPRGVPAGSPAHSPGLNAREWTVDQHEQQIPQDQQAPSANGAAGRPTIFLDRFLENAVEVDVDALCDGHEVWIGGIMQHVEEAGVHSGDSACVLPPHSLGEEMLEQIRGRHARHRAWRRRRRAAQRRSTPSTRAACT